MTSTENTAGRILVRWNQRTSGKVFYLLTESTKLKEESWIPSSAVISDSAV